MKKYKVYGMGAALVDTEIKVEDRELDQMSVEKGMMTLVDQDRQAQLLGHLEGHLVKASHASGGSAGNSVLAAALFGGPCYMSCRVADDDDGRIYLRDLDSAGISYPPPAAPRRCGRARRSCCRWPARATASAPTEAWTAAAARGSSSSRGRVAWSSAPSRPGCAASSD